MLWGENALRIWSLIITFLLLSTPGDSRVGQFTELRTIEALRGKWKKWKELWRIIPSNIFFTYFLSHKHRKENNQTVRLCKCVNVVSVPPCGSRLQSEFTFNLWVKNDWLDKMVKLCAAVFCYLNQLQYFNQIWHIIHCTVLYGRHMHLILYVKVRLWELYPVLPNPMYEY